MTFGIWAWVGFNLFVFAMLALDLGVLNRKDHVIRFKEAMIWSVVWVVVALLFNVGLYFYADPGVRSRIAQEFLAGYLIERALSIDNIFVFLMVFSYFQVPRKYQHRVLFWGILGALVFRGAMIGAGSALIRSFHWVLYVFGVFLILTGLKMVFHKPEEMDVANNKVLKLARRFLPISESTEHERDFVIRSGGRLLFTPLFLVLLVVETTDVVFALDSIPAIFGITDNAFIIYTSNVFAILGLRALYFVLAGVLDLFRYLSIGLSVVLVFIGVKMLAEGWYEIPIGWALGIVALILTVSVVASVVAARIEKKRDAEETLS